MHMHIHALTHVCAHTQAAAMRTLGGINVPQTEHLVVCGSLPREARPEGILTDLKSPFIRVLANPGFLYWKPYEQAHFLLFFQNFLNGEIRRI